MTKASINSVVLYVKKVFVSGAADRRREKTEQRKRKNKRECHHFLQVRIDDCDYVKTIERKSQIRKSIRRLKTKYHFTESPRSTSSAQNANGNG